MSKWELSEEELQHLNDTQFLKVKRSIIEKTFEHFKRCSSLIDTEILNGNYIFDPDLLKQPAKISKGENYEGLPYVVLDNPRYFSKTEVLSYRIVMWWGHHFSFSLHLEGKYAQKAVTSLGDIISKPSAEQIYYCIYDTPWEHHFRDDNYQLLSMLSADRIQGHFNKNSFVKIAKKATLSEWPLINDLAIENLQVLSKLTNLVRQS